MSWMVDDRVVEIFSLKLLSVMKVGMHINTLQEKASVEAGVLAAEPARR